MLKIRESVWNKQTPNQQFLHLVNVLPQANNENSQKFTIFFTFFFQNYETHLMKRDSSHCGSGDPLAPFGNAIKSFFVFKLFLILSFLISLLSLAVTLINAIQQNSSNNNNNNNNNNANSNMQMNMNMNAKKRALIFEVSPVMVQLRGFITMLIEVGSPDVSWVSVLHVLG